MLLPSEGETEEVPAAEDSDLELSQSTAPASVADEVEATD